MILVDLKIHHLRNISQAHLCLNSKFNFVYGPNGSGKTSVLEALYLLSCGHSFRSREISPIISQDQKVLTIFSRFTDNSTISIQKSSSEPTQIKLNNQFCHTTSQLAYALPCQIFYSDIFQIIDAGPSVRRSVLDWGLFHVKHNYLSLLKEYKRILKQRNALLKKHAPYEQFIPWDMQLSEVADQLNNLRENYFLAWQQEFFAVLTKLTDISCEINYYKGWDKKGLGKSLQQILTESFESDKHKLYTQHGAHQADIIIEVDANKAKHFLSRGQQKIILFALKLAQGNLLTQDCLYLMDDLPAELDELHQKRLLEYLSDRAGQYFITSNTNSESLSTFLQADYQSFKIDNGIIA